MIIQIEIFSSDNSELLKMSYDIRKHVFIDEQKQDKYKEFDGLDDQAVHFLTLVDGKPAANLRYVEKPDHILLDKLAVMPQYRHYGIFNVLIRYALRDLEKASKNLRLHSVKGLVAYYKRMGFEPEGEPFKENKILYQTMMMKKGS